VDAIEAELGRIGDIAVDEKVFVSCFFRFSEKNGFGKVV
jgi:hypothetical protein